MAINYVDFRHEAKLQAGQYLGNRLNDIAFETLRKDTLEQQAHFIAQIARMNPADLPADPIWQDLHNQAMLLTKEATILMIE